MNKMLSDAELVIDHTARITAEQAEMDRAATERATQAAELKARQEAERAETERVRRADQTFDHYDACTCTPVNRFGYPVKAVVNVHLGS